MMIETYHPELPTVVLICNMQRTRVKDANFEKDKAKPSFLIPRRLEPNHHHSTSEGEKRGIFIYNNLMQNKVPRPPLPAPPHPIPRRIFD